MNSQATLTDIEQLLEEIPLLDEFTKQAANAMCKLYGSENNKWGLLMPALIHEVSHRIGSTVDDIGQSFLDGQETFLPELMNTLRTPELLEEDTRLEKATRVRQQQLSATPRPSQSLDPFRDVPADVGNPISKESNDEWADDPDLIV